METWEADLAAQGYRSVAGLDEVGRGALFGPVVAAAVVLPATGGPEGIDDSKRLSPRRRVEAFRAIEAAALDWSLGLASAPEIDDVNVLEATRLAMKRAVRGLRRQPDHLLIDALLLEDVDIRQTSLIKGDGRCLSIAAASVMAKVARDTLMMAYGRRYRGYGLTRNMGYGTREHRRAIMRRGFCRLHRRSFRVQGELPFDARGRGDGPTATSPSSELSQET